MATETDSRDSCPHNDLLTKRSWPFFKMPNMTHLNIRLVMLGMLLLTASACQQNTSAQQPMSDAEAWARVDAQLLEEAKARARTDPFAAQELEADGSYRKYSVVAYGYNYTDYYIDSFEVDGAGGGNLEVSIPDAGGGKHTCCTTLWSGTPKGETFTIKWTRDRKKWCQQIVKLNDPVPPSARYLEVHFYQDGHIELFPSREASPPRLKLQRFNYAQRHETGNVNNDEKFSICKNGY